MRGYEVIVRDIWMTGKNIVVVVDMDDIPGLIFDYQGKYDFYNLKRRLKKDERIVVGISRDFSTITTQEEIRFLCA